MSKLLRKTVNTSVLVVSSAFFLFTCQKEPSMNKSLNSYPQQNNGSNAPFNSFSKKSGFDAQAEQIPGSAIKFAAWRDSCLQKLIYLQGSLHVFSRLCYESDSLYNATPTLRSSERLYSVTKKMDALHNANLAAFKKLRQDVVNELGAGHPFSKDVSRLVRMMENPYGKPSSALIYLTGKLIQELYGLELVPASDERKKLSYHADANPHSVQLAKV